MLLLKICKFPTHISNNKPTSINLLMGITHSQINMQNQHNAYSIETLTHLCCQRKYFAYICKDIPSQHQNPIYSRTPTYMNWPITFWGSENPSLSAGAGFDLDCTPAAPATGLGQLWSAKWFHRMGLAYARAAQHVYIHVETTCYGFGLGKCTNDDESVCDDICNDPQRAIRRVHAMFPLFMICDFITLVCSKRLCASFGRLVNTFRTAHTFPRL